MRPKVNIKHLSRLHWTNRKVNKHHIYLELLCSSLTAGRAVQMEAPTASTVMLEPALSRPGLIRAALLACLCFLPWYSRHGSYRQISLSFYGRKMNCLPSVGPQRWQKGKAVICCGSWQPQNSVLTSATLGYMVYTTHLLRKRGLVNCWRHSPLACLWIDKPFMRSGEPWFCGSVLFIKTKHENVLFCVKGLSRQRCPRS